ncbi:MAG: hypothetical protein HFJ64_00555 [Eggerthellaceae bacterium]|nr:hypothetical protein [Eggerthellaceae bacterium]
MKGINTKIKAVWGVSEIGFSITATLETAFFIFFLTDVAQLPLAISGIIAGGASAVDIISAAIAGVFIDKFHFKSGKYRPWLLYAPLCAMVFFILCFTKIGGDVTAGIIIAVGYIISHFFWNISYTAVRSLTNVLTDEPSERAFLSGRLGAGAALGRVCASQLVPWLTAALATLVSGVGAYTICAAIFSLIYIACMLIQFVVTKGYDTETKTEASTVSFIAMGKNIITNPNLIGVVLHDLLRLIAYYTVAAGTAYYAKVVIGDAAASGTILMVYYIGCFIGSFVAARVAKSIGTKNATIIGVAGWLVLWVIAFFVQPDYIVLNILLFISQVFFGFAYGLTVNLYSMCATWSHWKTGENTTGVTMSLMPVAVKVGVTLRAVILPAFLAFVGYDAAATTFDAAAQSGIFQMYFLLPIALLVVSLIPLIFLFKIKDKDVEPMSDEINEREKAGVIPESDVD